MNELIIFFLLIIIFNFLFTFKFEFFSRLINIYDHPNSRKIHKKKVPLLGGFLFIASIFFYFCFNQFQTGYSDFFFNLPLIIFLSIFFFIGVIDDKFEINSFNKTLLFFFSLFFLVYYNKNIQIENLRFETLDHSFQLNNLKIFFSVFCIFLFLNAFNMYDGINGQSGLYIIIIFGHFILKDINLYFSILIFLTSLFFLILNINNKIFLGNSGSLLMALLISTMIINAYNNGKISNCEEIFILLMLPGIDMARLFIQRILNKKNPFKADNQHLHHLLLKKFSPIKVITLNSLIILFSLALLYMKFNSVIIISSFMLIYTLTIFRLYNEK